jgi:putative ATPase
MKELDYGKGYQYAHDYDEKITAMECLPESLKGRRYYLPTNQGREARVKERLEQILEWKRAARDNKQ